MRQTYLHPNARSTRLGKILCSIAASLVLLGNIQIKTEAFQGTKDVATIIAENRANFKQCLEAKKLDALAAGVSQARIDKEFSLFKFVPRVIELDRSQPEFVSTFPNYFSKRVNKWRIEKGREKYEQYKPFLKTLTSKYGIPGHYIIAIWGMETNYGGYKGKMSTLDSLATLACDKRRSKFFSSELFLALNLMDKHGLTRDNMLGSWAGAMGHTQFMPTTYTNYAIDGDGNKQIDLFNSEKDALASAANFLWQLGWEPGLRWGREVLLPKQFDYKLANSQTKTLSDWRTLGIVQGNGTSLPVSNIKAKLRVPVGHQGPAFLTYTNFNIIMRWNNSEFYSIAVGQLANQIAGGGGLYTPLPEVPNFKIANIAILQNRLNQLGFNVGKADGIMGPATREGLRQFQIQNGLVADGFPSPDTVQRVLDSRQSEQ